MKKNGYTLAEALISLTVIGVIAALIVPMANKFRPDTTKVMFLKTYDSVVEITQELVLNTQIYPLLNIGDIINYESYPLANLTSWSDGSNQYTGIAKYCTLLARSFGADNISCDNNNNNQWINLNDSDFSSSAFTASNGVVFDIKSGLLVGSSDDLMYQSNIYFDVDGLDKGNNCYYNFENCPKPDRFKLMVAANGKMTAGDSKSQYYLNTRTDLKLVKNLTDLVTQYPPELMAKDFRLPIKNVTP